MFVFSKFGDCGKLENMISRMEREDEQGDEERAAEVQAMTKGSIDMNGQLNEH